MDTNRTVYSIPIKIPATITFSVKAPAILGAELRMGHCVIGIIGAADGPEIALDFFDRPFHGALALEWDLAIVIFSDPQYSPPSLVMATEGDALTWEKVGAEVYEEQLVVRGPAGLTKRTFVYTKKAGGFLPLPRD